MKLLAQKKKQGATTMSPKERVAFAQDLMAWYRVNARELPWRGIHDPYRTWLSEIMLQQTRVNAVVDHYQRFLRRFPTVVSLALAPEEDVLALWSGLGYYRRARMLHRAAKLLVEEYDGALPGTSVELRRMPGVGIYTSAAIASIAFGEQIAVVDGNVERVLLRILGQPEQDGAKATEMLNKVAQSLVPEKHPGDHNQAMMELGATICLPKGPKCDECPVFAYCKTRGEHETAPRARMRSERVSYALCTRKAAVGVGVEVLLQRRPKDASLMAGMLELPQIAAVGLESVTPVLTEPPVLRVRHAIVGTNYYVEIFAMPRFASLRKQMLQQEETDWVRTTELQNRPLTGLARKVLQRLKLMKAPAEAQTPEMPLLIGRGGRASTGEQA